MRTWVEKPSLLSFILVPYQVYSCVRSWQRTVRFGHWWQAVNANVLSSLQASTAKFFRWTCPTSVVNNIWAHRVCWRGLSELQLLSSSLNLSLCSSHNSDDCSSSPYHPHPKATLRFTMHHQNTRPFTHVRISENSYTYILYICACFFMLIFNDLPVRKLCF